MILLIVKKSLRVTWQNIWPIVRAIHFHFVFMNASRCYNFLEYRAAVRRLGDQAGDFHEIVSRIRYKDRISISALLQEALRELPMVIPGSFRLYPYNLTDKLKDCIYSTSRSISRLYPAFFGVLATYS